MSKLLVIRGPSGSGKSTIANEILKRSNTPLLVVGEDKLRKMFSDHHSTPHPASEQLAAAAIKIGLACGYDVIYHGILNVKSGEFRPNELLSLNPQGTYFFYLDVSFDETIRRHATRTKKHEFGAEAMKRWWEYSSPIGDPRETVVKENSSLEDTVATIVRICEL